MTDQCPHCGTKMKPHSKAIWLNQEVQIYECKDHGLFIDLPIGLFRVEVEQPSESKNIEACK